MNANGLDIQTISTKWTDFKADHALLLKLERGINDKAQPVLIPSHFGHFPRLLLACRTIGSSYPDNSGYGCDLTRRASSSQIPKSNFFTLTPKHDARKAHLASIIEVL
jgi:hypothetical protein